MKDLAAKKLQIAEANARLIAASDLLEACKEAINMSSLLEELHDIDTTVKRHEQLSNHIDYIKRKLTQAIAKAEG